MPARGRDNLALVWLGVLIESHSPAVASELVLIIAAASAIWYALR